MAARTCLLCGKALSRIWADKGEEFCSREHRNQYRLRRGMDRLMEASAVASVMRRREIPKQIPAGDLQAPGPASPRAFLDALRRPPAGLSLPVVRPAGRPRLNGASRFALARSLSEGTAEPRDSAQPARFAGPPARAPRVRLRLPAHVMPAPPAKARPRNPGASERRTPAIRWRGDGKPKVAALLARGTSRAASAMPDSRPARSLTAPSVGRALRVSTAARFRLPERAAPSTAFPAPQVHGLPRPGEKRFAAAAAPKAVAPNLLTIEATPAEMRIPSAPGSGVQSRLRWPGAFEIPVQFRNAANEARLMAVPFGVPEDSAKERR